MAIITHYFGKSSYAENANEVLTWLTENASEYFDSFALDTTNNSGYPSIICSLGDTAKLTFKTKQGIYSSGIPSADGFTSLGITVAGGATLALKGMGSAGNSYSYVEKATKTDNGIILYMTYRHYIFISKSNENTTSVYCAWYSSDATSGYYYSVDLINGTSITKQDIISKVESSTMTALMPLLVSATTYTPNMLLSVNSQYKGVTGIIDVDGTKYAYDGYVALAE